MNPLAYTWDTLKEAYYAAFDLIVANVLWFFLTIIIITAPPAAAGLYYVSNQISHGEMAGAGSFFEGFRKYFWVSWRWFLTIAGFLLTLVVNIIFYGNVQAAWAPWIQGFFIGIAILWLLINIYTFPLLLEQQTPSMRLALKNSIVIYLSSPAWCLWLVVFLLTIIVLSTLTQLPWVLITASLCAFFANRFLLEILKKVVR